jgi:Matrixin
MTKLKWVLCTMPLLAIAILVIHVLPAYSFLPETTLVGGTAVGDHWGTIPMNWVINATRSSSVVGATQVTTVITNSFATWASVPNAAISATASGTSTISNDQVPAGTNLVCFVCNGTNLNFTTDGTLALTVTGSSGGVISQANIFFNPAPGGVCFATDTATTSCPTSTDAVQDLQTVATHEIGHFFGLDHSGVVRATMFPFAPPIETKLSFDDVAGISALYPVSSPVVPTGSIKGSVTLAATGAAVFGAHVTANSTTSADAFSSFPKIRKSPIGTLTLPDGTYTISGLPADTYVVIAEPLNGPENASDVEWGNTFGQTVQTNFTSRWH